jgi:hypothetical protein
MEQLIQLVVKLISHDYEIVQTTRSNEKDDEGNTVMNFGFTIKKIS